MYATVGAMVLVGQTPAAQVCAGGAARMHRRDRHDAYALVRYDLWDSRFIARRPLLTATLSFVSGIAGIRLSWHPAARRHRPVAAAHVLVIAAFARPCTASAPPGLDRSCSPPKAFLSQHRAAAEPAFADPRKSRPRSSRRVKTRVAR